MPKVAICLLDFIHTAHLGPLAIGVPREVVLSKLGTPDEMIPENPDEDPYPQDLFGCLGVQYDYDRRRVNSFHLNLWNEETPNAGPSAELDPWIFRRGLSLAELVDNLDRHGIEHRLVPSQCPENQILESGNLFFLFEPSGLCYVSTRTANPFEVPPEAFWQAYRREIGRVCTVEALNSSHRWTEAVTTAAEKACHELAPEVIVDRETAVKWKTLDGQKRHGRLDVTAKIPGEPFLLVAFESELAPVGYMGRTHAKPWREEFIKLCGVRAQLRVLSSYFMPGTGGSFESFLRRELDSMADHFQHAVLTQWLLVFGSENSSKDPDQPWFAYSLEPDFSLRPVGVDLPPLCPRRIALGFDKLDF